MSTTLEQPPARASARRILRADGSGRHDRALVSAAFFVFFGAQAAYLGFIAIWYRSLGFDEATIGWLTGLPLVVSIVVTPMWGALADSRHRHRAVLATSATGAGLAAVVVAGGDRLAWLLPAVLLHAALACPLPSLLDSGALVAAGGRPAAYGRLRLWGSIGWGVSALGVGALVSRSGPHSLFWAYGAFIALLAVCALRLPVGRRVVGRGYVREAATLVRDRRLWTFLGVAFLGGAGISMTSAYVPLHLDGLGALHLVGPAFVLTVAVEVPFMLVAGRVIDRVGPGRALVGAAVVYGVRAAALSMVGSAWAVVALQATHGAAFAVFWVAGVTLARRLAPDGLRATSQGLFTAATTLGLGGAVGTVVGGALFAAYGPAATFRLAAVLLAVGVPLVAVLGRGPFRPAPAVA